MSFLDVTATAEDLISLILVLRPLSLKQFLKYVIITHMKDGQGTVKKKKTVFSLWVFVGLFYCSGQR